MNAGEDLSNFNADRGYARQRRQWVLKRRPGIFLRIEDYDGHTDSIDRFEPVCGDKSGCPRDDLKAIDVERITGCSDICYLHSCDDSVNRGLQAIELRQDYVRVGFRLNQPF
jgi:hypothetical protein